MITAVLIVKAASQRVPGKNFRPLGGRPLFRWPVDTLLGMPEIGRLVINTDARNLLVEAGLPDDPRLVLDDRRPGLCGDDVTADRLLADVLPRFESSRYLMTHATSPFLTAGTIRRAIEVLDGSGADSLYSANRFQTRLYGEDGRAINHDPRHLLPTQDLEPWFEENSALYLFSAESFARTGSRIGQSPLRFVTPRWESIDIDDEDDWALAALVAEGLGSRGDAAR